MMVSKTNRTVYVVVFRSTLKHGVNFFSIDNLNILERSYTHDIILVCYQNIIHPLTRHIRKRDFCKKLAIHKFTIVKKNSYSLQEKGLEN